MKWKHFTDNRDDRQPVARLLKCCDMAIFCFVDLFQVLHVELLCFVIHVSSRVCSNMKPSLVPSPLPNGGRKWAGDETT